MVDVVPKGAGGVLLVQNEAGGEAFLRRLEGKKPLYVCVIGTSETGKIPGLSAAGANPELTDYTPPADVELLLHGRCRCMDGVPVTPDGIPTPGLITMSALRLAGAPVLVVNGGVRIRPLVPYIELGGLPGGDIRTGNAVRNVGEVIGRAAVAGENLAGLADYMVIGESLPGGTTTALGVLLAMGVDARGKVSSTLPSNPHDLKAEAVMAGLKAAGESPGSLADDPVRAVSCVGDPMIPAFAGLVMGAAPRVPLIMAGGTQMGAILAVVKGLRPEALAHGNVAIGTTRWVACDRTSDLRGIVGQIADVPILAADLDFGGSRFAGLRAYEVGLVKEGVGAGGASIAAMSRGIGMGALLAEIERSYEVLMEGARRVGAGQQRG